MAGLARLAASDTAVALENMPILVELGDIGMSNQMTVWSQFFTILRYTNIHAFQF